MAQKSLDHKVHVRTFHQWCSQQLSTYNIPKSRNANLSSMFEENVQKVIDHAETGIIPKGQYDAILIDEGHDFEDAWYKLIVQMVNPDNPCLLVLYDDAQSIYSKDKRKLVFSKVGINARGRTVILKLNYRNTKEILTVAKLFAEQLLVERKESDEDAIPLLEPVGAGLNGDVPVLINLPSMHHEVRKIIETLYEHQKNGLDWHHMAVLCRNNKSINIIKDALRNNGIPTHGEEVEGIGVHVMTMHKSKGLEFALVCIFEVGNKNVCYESVENEAQLLYVAMTRATTNLVMTCSSSSMFAPQLSDAISTVNYSLQTEQ
ncbi:3'-5' exonuclease [Wohlfahrtiimonas larvae]|uniref:UvrD-like helicase C-terminal domain-containing protein n=1 Tax=Wohlfahrtiimonas larvae TaxID=1157986 RepID=A0ABP9MZT2_9GAMM|nr:3'-5' exonuclease [Wohlfahrtiimonas larvae]